MRLPVLLAVVLLLICTSCKLEPLSATPNSNTASPSPAPAASAGSDEQKTTNCSLTLAGAPVINGVKLGMTTDELWALFPGSSNDSELRASASGVTQFGSATVVIRPDQYGSKEKFAGIREITARLLDGRVYNYTVNYNGPEYSHVDKFVATIAEGANLPSADQWEAYVGMDNTLKTLRCTEIEVRAFIGGPGGNLNYLDVKDLIADKNFKDRRKAKAQAQASPTPGK